jgi:hypothetical protein
MQSGCENVHETGAGNAWAEAGNAHQAGNMRQISAGNMRQGCAGNTRQKIAVGGHWG